MELQELKDQLVKWMDSIKYGYRDSDSYMMETESIDGKQGVRIVLFTDVNKYNIVAYAPSDDYSGYLGAMGSSRKPRAGEDWTRGNDLADGDFSQETWIEILGDIVGYELVKIHRSVKYLYGVEEPPSCRGAGIPIEEFKSEK
ncbi:hypothetical protein LCGC14_1071190 [marine sediment metagenome]|uniref:Uncharacterized protein n=1 Tax=marine sediment metagenome TaxID=412755 RepID=A0A0F9MI39_9ZZZZ